jgi:hypothetical protein
MVGTTAGEWTISPDAAQSKRKFCHAAGRATISKALQLAQAARMKAVFGSSPGANADIVK